MRNFKSLLVFLLITIKCCKLQKPNTDNRKHDVYIAGFFPFGKGVENSDTGKYPSAFLWSILILAIFPLQVAA